MEQNPDTIQRVSGHSSNETDNCNTMLPHDLNRTMQTDLEQCNINFKSVTKPMDLMDLVIYIDKKFADSSRKTSQLSGPELVDFVDENKKETGISDEVLMARVRIRSHQSLISSTTADQGEK